MANKTILIVDDDKAQRSLLETFLSKCHYDIYTAESGREALESLSQRSVDMIISDVRMPEMSGLELMDIVNTTFPELPMLMVTAFPDIRDAVQAVRHGVVNYLEKPIEFDELLEIVKKTLGNKEPVALDPVPDTPGIIAESPVMKRILEEAYFVAPTNSRVLISGESGTGKEIVSSLIHQWSSRLDKPFLKVNCAALHGQLLESELFGHEKGSFTGADKRRIGRFEEADGGTLFLDEIGEMSLELQPKLLRVIQEGIFQRVGSNKDIYVDVRIIAATNRDLEEEVQKGAFREDLFYRINTIEIMLPPLRARKDDIMPLATSFAESFLGRKPSFSTSVINRLVNYNWPGNIRELQNAIERATLMSRGSLIIPDHLPRRIVDSEEQPQEQPSQTGTIEDIERIHILQTLKEHNYNRTETAQVLAISRRSLIYKLHKYEDQGFKTSE